MQPGSGFGDFGDRWQPIFHLFGAFRRAVQKVAKGVLMPACAYMFTLSSAFVIYDVSLALGVSVAMSAKYVPL